MTCPCGVHFCYACGVLMHSGHLHRCPDVNQTDSNLNERRARKAGELALKEYPERHSGIRARRKPNIDDLVDTRERNMTQQRIMGNRNPLSLNRPIGADQLPRRIEPLYQRGQERQLQELFGGDFARHEVDGNRDFNLRRRAEKFNFFYILIILIACLLLYYIIVLIVIKLRY